MATPRLKHDGNEAAAGLMLEAEPEAEPADSERRLIRLNDG